MSKNSSTGFWDVYRTIKKTAKQEGLKLSSKKVFNISNYYMRLLEDAVKEDEELQCDFDPTTYKDPTGDAAVKHWFRLMARSLVTQAIRASICSAAMVTDKGIVRCDQPAVHVPGWDTDNPVCEHHMEQLTKNNYHRKKKKPGSGTPGILV
ncbi:hypothetical protein [Auritidibacter ignavus]|uniref:Uncharacterized protein n=1 Tax=Auritidibacter ignavus TaxID=678932 RepID=A0AAJ6ALA1_9MICC|nr:hypothetical protein [Auritidibacter ignavus]NIH72247.1 hypothetical protein [Auritidibacter ignavus]RMX23742.1 hypothetical protein DYI20_02685 [Auritidibacter ignavus]WGH82502.1 hypothetical protein QDX25_04955 [Auritidibacter ignavus]WGH87067.1 hypothetical protein QDX24_04530 [Auritidibacter ignavus]WGH89351.1 hypothetical protein QDX22_04525 [Auritidibacter ignavus]